MSRRLLPTLIFAVALAAAGATAATPPPPSPPPTPRCGWRAPPPPPPPRAPPTIVFQKKITNLTGRTLHGGWEFTYSTPTDGIGAAIAGSLGPGVWAHDVFRRKVTASTPKGRYTLTAEADDHHGRSHATIHATVG